MGMIDQDRVRVRDGHGRRHANPRSIGRRRPGGAAADLRPRVSRLRQARPHARHRPPDPRPVPRQLRAGQPGAEGCSKPASCWPSRRPRTSRSTCSPTCRRSRGRDVKDGGRRERAEAARMAAISNRPDPESPTRIPSSRSPIRHPHHPRRLQPHAEAERRRARRRRRGRGAGGRPAGQGDRHAAEHLDRRPAAASSNC